AGGELLDDHAEHRREQPSGDRVPDSSHRRIDEVLRGTSRPEHRGTDLPRLAARTRNRHRLQRCRSEGRSNALPAEAVKLRLSLKAEGRCNSSAAPFVLCGMRAWVTLNRNTSSTSD